MIEVPMNRRNLLDLALNNSCNGCNLTPCCDFEALGNLATNLIESLQAQLAKYDEVAAEYGIDGKTMLALAKSQIRTAQDNIKLQEQLTALREKADFVRCKYCEYWQDNNGGYPHEECRWGHDETPDADDFCSCGKRLEEQM